MDEPYRLVVAVASLSVGDWPLVCPVGTEKKLEKEINDAWPRRKKGREDKDEKNRGLISGEAVSRG